jgi:hypothetical protein
MMRLSPTVSPRAIRPPAPGPRAYTRVYVARNFSFRRCPIGPSRFAPVTAAVPVGAPPATGPAARPGWAVDRPEECPVPAPAGSEREDRSADIGRPGPRYGSRRWRRHARVNGLDRHLCPHSRLISHNGRHWLPVPGAGSSEPVRFAADPDAASVAFLRQAFRIWKARFDHRQGAAGSAPGDRQGAGGASPLR